LPPFPWKYSATARGAAGSSDQPCSRSPSAVATDHDVIWMPGSVGGGVAPALGKKAKCGSTSRTRIASAAISTTTTTTGVITGREFVVAGRLTRPMSIGWNCFRLSANPSRSAEPDVSSFRGQEEKGSPQKEADSSLDRAFPGRDAYGHGRGRCAGAARRARWWRGAGRLSRSVWRQAGPDRLAPHRPRRADALSARPVGSPRQAPDDRDRNARALPRPAHRGPPRRSVLDAQRQSSPAGDAPPRRESRRRAVDS